jgi:hypothetical protein
MILVEINSEIRAHLPAWRQTLLNILEKVEHEKKSEENRKTRIKSQTEPSESGSFSHNARRTNTRSLQRTDLIVSRKYCNALIRQTNDLEVDL